MRSTSLPMSVEIVLHFLGNQRRFIMSKIRSDEEISSSESAPKKTPSEEKFSTQSLAEAAMIEAQIIATQNEQISELRSLIGSLGERVAAAQATNAREAQFKSAVQSVEAAAIAVQRGIAPAVSVEQHSLNPATGQVRDANCGPCECLDSACCTFEIWMSHVRADQMQLPIDIGDSNILPTSVMEIWMFSSIDHIHNVGVCIPDASPLSYLPLHKQITEPFGPWTSVNRLVGTTTVRKGSPLKTEISLTAVERENALERVKPVNRDEWGTAAGIVTLDCCYSDYSPILISVPLSSWGQAGGVITGRFIVVKRCC
jgi:hypothetical protein